MNTTKTLGEILDGVWNDGHESYPDDDSTRAIGEAKQELVKWLQEEISAIDDWCPSDLVGSYDDAYEGGQIAVLNKLRKAILSD